jgi:rhomboid protease GluP
MPLYLHATPTAKPKPHDPRFEHRDRTAVSTKLPQQRPRIGRATMEGVARLRITYNSPVVLTFALAAVLAYIVTYFVPDLTWWFVASPHIDGPRTYVGLVSHILGHASWAHLFGNFMLILLLGPILEERHGSVSLLGMIVITALVTGLVNVAVSSHVLLGASGIVFMMILLASTANIRQGAIPLTFIAVALVYLGSELIAAFRANDGISHLAHLVGGATGATLGFLGARARGAKQVATQPILPMTKPAPPTKPAPKKTAV